MYKFQSSGVLREDGAFIPFDPANADYLAFLAWKADGNVPAACDAIDPRAAILAQIAAIESSTMVPRVTREFMMRVAEKDAVAVGTDLTHDAAYQRVKAVDDQVRALRTRLTS